MYGLYVLQLRLCIAIWDLEMQFYAFECHLNGRLFDFRIKSLFIKHVSVICLDCEKVFLL